MAGNSMIRAASSRAVASLFRRLRSRADPDRIRSLTGASREEWREIAHAFPALPPEPGPAAARARQRLATRWVRAMATGRWRVRLDGPSPDLGPAVYLTAHVGSLQALRYVLRSRGVAAATVHGPHNLDRTRAVQEDRVFDRRYALDFPHAFAAGRPHRLRTALERGSLILAADLPPEPGTVFANLLGGRAALDGRPLRLARAARVPCRAAFLTLPREGWTLTLSPPLAGSDAEALAEFARTFERVALQAPLDLDPTVYRALARGTRQA